MNGIDILVTVAGLAVLVLVVSIAEWRSWDERRRDERLQDRRISRVTRESSWFDDTSSA